VYIFVHVRHGNPPLQFQFFFEDTVTLVKSGHYSQNQKNNNKYIVFLKKFIKIYSDQERKEDTENHHETKVADNQKDTKGFLIPNRLFLLSVFYLRRLDAVAA
jgi:hypothetical protein